MTKQGERGDHFPGFLILNAVASGFSVPSTSRAGPRAQRISVGIRISSRGNGHVIYCCCQDATGAPALGRAG